MDHDDDFCETCQEMLSAFPQTAPEVVVPEGGDGDYGHAQELFALHGSDWDCSAVFLGRSLIHFVNDETFRFLLPRMVCCSYSVKGGIDADILDYVIFGLKRNMARLTDLFLDTERASLIAPLKILLGYVRDEEGYATSETASEIQEIIDALAAGRRSESRPIS